MLLSAGVAWGEEQRVRAVFVGDIMVHEQQLNAAKTTAGSGKNRIVSWDFRPQFERAAFLFSGADLVVGNLETTLSGPARGYTGYPAFKSPDELMDGIALLSPDLLALANNHIFDGGGAGALRTMQVLEERGIRHTGIVAVPEGGSGLRPSPLLLEKDGVRWGFVNYTYGTNNPRIPRGLGISIISEDLISQDLTLLEAMDPDVLIALFHWGQEYRFVPTRQQRAIVDLCLSRGVDLIVGAHPHVLQPVEILPKKGGVALAAFSLGNFVSGQRTLPRERAAVLAVEFVRSHATGKLSLDRVMAAPTWVSYYAQGNRRRLFTLYAGDEGRIPASLYRDIPADQLKHAREAGRFVLDFLGAAQIHPDPQDPGKLLPVPDDQGYYLLWDSRAPDLKPRPRVPAPMPPKPAAPVELRP
jgi:poly-gamma-glutamate synthesis protein (capsule biosynthesis protein)